jgi:phasin family protein
MNVDFLKDLTDKAKGSFEPIGKFNELLSRSVQDAFKIQIASGKNYSDFAAERFKAMSDIRDMESLQGYCKDQVAALSQLNEQMMSDMNALAESGSKFRDEVEALMKNEPSEEAAAEAKTTTKTSAKQK